MRRDRSAGARAISKGMPGTAALESPMTTSAIALDADPPPQTLSAASDLPLLLEEVHRFVGAFVRPAADAEDATAETFRAALGRMRFPIPRAEARAWLFAVARRRIADHARRRRHAPLTEMTAPVGDAEIGPAVRAVLAALPPDQAQALVLKYALGFSTDETARALGRSPAATNSLLQRARAAFAERGASLVEAEAS